MLLTLLVGSAIAAGIAAAQYPGGTWMDRAVTGHSFWGNFLCDIARDVALDGSHHPGARWGRAAEWGLVLALLLFWWLVPALFRSVRRLGPVPVLGALSAAGLALVPVTSSVAHGVALVVSAGPGFAAAVLAVHGLRTRPALAGLGTAALVLSAIDLGLYLVYREPPFPLALPAVQRLALLAAWAWMAASALTLAWPRELPGRPSAAPGSASQR